MSGMSSRLTLEEIRQLVRDGDKVDQSVANRLVLAVMAEMSHDLGDMRQSMAALAESTDKRMMGVQTISERQYLEIKAAIDKLNLRMDAMESNPSITWLLRYRPGKTISAILALFVVISIVVTYAPDVLAAIIGLF